MEGGEDACGRDFKDRTGPVSAALERDAIEIAVAGLDQLLGMASVLVVIIAIGGAKGVESGVDACGRDVKDRTDSVVASQIGHTVHVAVAGLDQVSGNGSVRVVRVASEG